MCIAPLNKVTNACQEFFLQKIICDFVWNDIIGQKSSVDMNVPVQTWVQHRRKRPCVLQKCQDSAVSSCFDVLDAACVSVLSLRLFHTQTVAALRLQQHTIFTVSLSSFCWPAAFCSERRNRWTHGLLFLPSVTVSFCSLHPSLLYLQPTVLTHTSEHMNSRTMRDWGLIWSYVLRDDRSLSDERNFLLRFASGQFLVI